MQGYKRSKLLGLVTNTMLNFLCLSADFSNGTLFQYYLILIHLAQTVLIHLAPLFSSPPHATSLEYLVPHAVRIMSHNLHTG